MTTRFNTLGNTSGVATETTLNKVKDVLKDTLQVNVVSQPLGNENINISQIDGVNVSATAGVMDVQVTNFPVNGSDINMVSINSNPVSTGPGDATNSQRVVLSTNESSSSLPIQIKRNYVSKYHHAFYAHDLSATTGQSYRFLDNSDHIFLDESIPVNLNYFLTADTTVAIESTSIDDTFTGTGARQVLVEFYLESGTISTLIVNLNGTTPVSFGPIFRIKRLFVVYTGNTNFNNGYLTISVPSTPGMTICGNMEPFTNKWNCAHIYIPSSPVAPHENTISRGRFILDYLNGIISNTGGSNETIRVYMRLVHTGITFTPWQLLNQWDSDTNSTLTSNLSNIEIDISFQNIDIIWVYKKPGGTGSMSYSLAFGGHVE